MTNLAIAVLLLKDVEESILKRRMQLKLTQHTTPGSCILPPGAADSFSV